MVNIDRLKKTTKENGWSLTFLCEKLGVAHSYFTDVKNGKTKISEERLKKIASLLGTTPDYLLGKTDEKEPHRSKKEDTLAEVHRIFNSLSPENQAKLLELSRLYLEHQEQRQRKKEKGPAPDDGGET